MITKMLFAKTRSAVSIFALGCRFFGSVDDGEEEGCEKPFLKGPPGMPQSCLALGATEDSTKRECERRTSPTGGDPVPVLIGCFKKNGEVEVRCAGTSSCDGQPCTPDVIDGEDGKLGRKRADKNFSEWFQSSSLQSSYRSVTDQVHACVFTRCTGCL